MQMEDKRIVERPPTQRDSFVESLKRVSNESIGLPSKPRLLMMFVGVIVLWLVGLCYYGYLAAESEDFWFALTTTIPLGGMMLLLTVEVYEMLLTLLG